MSSSTIQLPRVLVCQRGARHRYAIPRMFEEAGMLAALYSDSSVHSLAGKTARCLDNTGIKHSLLGALASRNPNDIPVNKIYSFDNLIFPNRSNRLSRSYKKAGLQHADVVYSMCGEEFEFLQYAKEQGARLIIDIFVHPGTAKIVEKEMLRYLGKSGVETSGVDAVEGHFRRSFALADIILCPSNWVAEGVREYAPQHAEKIRMVPYGSSLDICGSTNETPTVGRIFFAGREALRKGLHYLADAARILRARGMEIDVRVAGISHGDLDWIQNCGELNCLGTLPMDQMHSEFRQADVFVLPSLSEGQAGVVLEAMACGCPVVATRECGVDFQPGCGIIVPARDAGALADGLAHVIGNRTMRNELALGALTQVADFSMNAWKSRLIDVVKETVLI